MRYIISTSKKDACVYKSMYLYVFDFTFHEFVFSGTAEDYKLLEQMNKVTIGRYSEMKHISHNISKSMKDLNDKCK